MNKKLSILVSSCDKYSDIWEPFFGMFFKYWGDCPYDIYLCAENKKYQNSRVKTINPQKDQTWSERLLWALDKVESEYVLLLLEDYIFLKKVDNARIKKCLDVLAETNAACIRLIPVPGPDEDLKDDIGIVSKGSKYRVSTQGSIWNKRILQGLLRKEESVWDFEMKGTVRSNDLDNLFLSVKEDGSGVPVEEGDYPLTYYCTAVHRGKWRREAVKIINDNNFNVDLKARPQETRFEMYKRIFERMVYRLRNKPGVQ